MQPSRVLSLQIQCLFSQRTISSHGHTCITLYGVWRAQRDMRHPQTCNIIHTVQFSSPLRVHARERVGAEHLTQETQFEMYTGALPFAGCRCWWWTEFIFTSINFSPSFSNANSRGCGGEWGDGNFKITSAHIHPASQAYNAVCKINVKFLHSSNFKFLSRGIFTLNL